MTQRPDEIFQELGISQYLGAFVDQGFDTWETISDITESDFATLRVKLGHRRKLQRRIASLRGTAPGIALLPTVQLSIENARLDAHRLDVADGGHRDLSTGAVTKRKYRRHPKPDEAAPHRPCSAYVLFSNKIREDSKGRNLTFTEIAKLVGENWKNLTETEKQLFEKQSRTAKDKYNQDLAVYKKTPEYEKYMVYLQSFQAKHSAKPQSSSAPILPGPFTLGRPPPFMVSAIDLMCISDERASKRSKSPELRGVGLRSVSNDTPPRTRSATRSRSSIPAVGSEPSASQEQRAMLPRSPTPNYIRRSMDIAPDLSISPLEAPSRRSSRQEEGQCTESGHQWNHPSPSNQSYGSRTAATNGTMPTTNADVYGGYPRSHLNRSPGRTTAASDSTPHQCLRRESSSADSAFSSLSFQSQRSALRLPGDEAESFIFDAISALIKAGEIVNCQS